MEEALPVSEPPRRDDVFDESSRLLTPERLLRDPRANGEGVRVCVLDSGIERALLEEKFRAPGPGNPSHRGRRLHRRSPRAATLRRPAKHAARHDGRRHHA